MAIRVPGEGPHPAALLLVGEMPGIDEGRAGRVFAGRSGRELRRYLNGYELPTPEQVYLTNLSKTVAPTVKDMTVTAEDEEWLIHEIQLARPRLIGTLGATVTAWFLGDGHHLETIHGLPHPIAPDSRAAALWPAGVPRPLIMPGYNPAAMLHSPKLQSVFAYDMRRVGLALKGKLPSPTRDTAGRVYHPANGGQTVWEALLEPTGPLVVGVDTEGWTWAPWCLGFSTADGHGVVIKATDHGGLAAFDAAIHDLADCRVVLHSALHDFPVLRTMGVTIPDGALDDTMIMAYLLGLEPQGLKALAYRHAGMTMDEYADITADAQAIRTYSWLLTLYDTLPTPAKKIPKRDWLAAEAAQAPTGVGLDAKGKAVYYDRPLLDGDDVDKAHAKILIGRMLEKHGCVPALTKKWADSRAREILVDELQCLPFEADPPEATLDEIDPETAVAYAGRDPDATRRVHLVLRPQITAMGLDDVYQTDLAILPMIDRMQTVGIGVDVDHFRAYAGFLDQEEILNRQLLAECVGHPVNPNSGDQVAALLYEELRLHECATNIRIKRTKGSADKPGRLSTNDKTLDALSGLHPAVALIQDGREIRKLKSTYALAIPRLVGTDGRLHPHYRITRAETGRLSASDPNVLALPKHSARGKLIRHGFIAGEGHELGEWDLSQIEMAMFAHDSQDPVLLDAIRRGVDLHYDTAARVIRGLTVPANADKAWYQARLHKEKDRFPAKAVNFGILMGITPFGLLDQLHKNRQLHWRLDPDPRDPTIPDTTTLLAKWHRTYTVASAYIKAKHVEARRYGFVRDHWGRLRWLEGIHSTDDYIRAEAERMAQATPTQSGAQGIIKRVMAAVWPRLVELRRIWWVEPLLQVHDALVLEYEFAARDTVHAIMTDAMEHTVSLSIPIRCARETGARLSELGD